jgi:RNA polymerase sigma factor (sigma-70 family)
MTSAREHRLVLAAKAGSTEARSALVEAFMPSIGGVARAYRSSPSIERRELMQEGVVGLLRAVDRYDPELGTPFWAYASWWVRQAMQQLVSELTRPFVMSDRALRQLARVKDARRTHAQRFFREATTAELAEATGLRLRQVDNLMSAERRPRGIDEPLSGEPGTGGTFGDLIADPHAEEAYDGVAVHLVEEDLPRLLELLTERERLVVTGHFGLGEHREQTLRELGDSLGVSAERVRQIEQRALDKLRDATTLRAA